MTVYIIFSLMVSVQVLVIFLLLSARSRDATQYRKELEDLRSAKRRAEQAAVKAQMGERAAVAELRHLRAQQQQQPGQEFSAATPQTRVPTPAKQPAQAHAGHTSSAPLRRSRYVSSQEDVSPVTAALLVHAMTDTHSYGDYSDAYSDSCSSSYSDSCGGGGDYGGGGCDSGGCGGD